MPSAIILGSGPSAAAVALALSDDPTYTVDIIDVGIDLEPANAEARARLSAGVPSVWDRDDVASVAMQPVAVKTRGLPEKRVFGSDYPFRDVGQLHGMSSDGDTNTSLVSPAFGGFSTVWGAQVMPFSAATFDAWPFGRDELAPHYRAVLRHVPYAGGHDDLERLFPHFVEPQPLPELAPRTQMVLDAYTEHRDRLERLGVTVGAARLALQPSACVRCGLCMTGCPYGYVYSASQTLDPLVQSGRVTRHSGLLALRVRDEDDTAVVEATELCSGRLRAFSADRVFVACGAVGSTRVMLNSLRRYDQPVDFQESAQFLMPVMSRAPTADPRATTEFTLNQFNVVVALDEAGFDVSQVHFYPYNEAVQRALPAVLRHRLAEPLTRSLLRRLSVGIGYLPSWASPGISLRASAPLAPGQLPRVHVAGERVRAPQNAMFRKVARRLIAAAPYLDLWPALPATTFAAPGKSYHWGGSFPHRARPRRGDNSTDVLGRVPGFDRVHLVDAAVFPTVPATTFTLSIMANAHRIATATKVLDHG